jgi:Holliday junction DNA helicase RuvA
MIYSLRGVLRTLTENQRAVLDVGGVGYEIYLPAFVHQEFTRRGANIGDEVEFEIYYHVTERQPRPILVGFLDAFQKAFFERIITVEGIGPLKAITALDMPPTDAIRAIEAGDVGTISQMPGIGQRVAQKVIATLQGKMGFADLPIPDTGTGSATFATPNVQAEAIQALIALQYRANEARRTVNEIVQSNPESAKDVESILREVFRHTQRARDDK